MTVEAVVWAWQITEWIAWILTALAYGYIATCILYKTMFDRGKKRNAC